MNGAFTVILLTISNIFMTFAWYGHLRFKSAPLWEAILISWLIAFMEYCFQVPANRIGSFQFSAAQLKIIQEVITLIVFGVFSVLYLKQEFRWNYLVAFAFLIGAVFFVFTGTSGATPHQSYEGVPAGSRLAANREALKEVDHVQKISDDAVSK